MCWRTGGASSTYVEAGTSAIWRAEALDRKEVASL